jgi:hypothetical protein
MLSLLTSCQGNSSYRKHYDQIARYVQNEHLRARLKHALQLLQPFNDFIHQIEADHPALGRVCKGLVQLDTHVRSTTWEEVESLWPSLGEEDLLLFRCRHGIARVTTPMARGFESFCSHHILLPSSWIHCKQASCQATMSACQE